MRSSAARPPQTLALGASLATRGPIAASGLILAAVGALASIVAAFAMASQDGRSAARLPTLASEGVAWSAGVTLAFGAALRAVHRDREEGIVALVRARGATVGEYVRGRVGGLVMVLAAAVGGPALIATIAATSTGAPPMETVRSGAAALCYSIAFAATIGPVAMASLGARSRAGGYLTLLAVLVVPELVSRWSSALLPAGWHELTSIAAALDAVSAAVAGPEGDVAHGVRALAGLAAVVAVSLVVVGALLGRVDAEPGS